MHHTKTFLIKSFLMLATVEHLAALIWLAMIPSDPKNAVFLGYSSARILLMGGMLGVFILLTLISILITSSRSRLEQTIAFVDRFLGNARWRTTLILLLWTMTLAGCAVLLLPPERLRDAADQVVRLVPLICWGIAVSIQTLVCQFVWAGGRLRWENSAPLKDSLRTAGIVAGILLLSAVALIWSQLGIKPDRSGWNSPGTPILFVQVLLAFAASLAFLFREKQIEAWLSGLRINPGGRVRLDHLLSLILWSAALLTWWTEPLRKFSYFTPEPTPPNFEIYPYSDAAIYDENAQGILIGISRDFGLMIRPLYAFFLAFLHLLGGQKYETVVFLQLLALAFIPVFVFLIGSTFGNRTAGLVGAILIIFRERNSIALTNVIEVSHSKLLLSDVPALALMLLFVYVFSKWLLTERGSAKGVVAGAVLGFAVLLRSQVMLLAPVILIVIVVARWGRFRRVVQSGLVFFLGLALVVIPWTWRNYLLSGRFVVENTEFYIDLLASGYLSPGNSISTLPGESADAYYDRMIRQVVAYIKEYPDDVAWFYASHFIHNEIESVIILPMSFRLDELGSYVSRLRFWNEPFGDISTESGFLLTMNLGLIALGLGAVISRYKFIGLMPLLLHFGYSFSVVPMRMSGWRFILPFDWVPLLYFSFGLSQVGSLVAAVLFNRQIGRDLQAPGHDAPDYGQPEIADTKRMVLFSVVFLLAGLSFPLIERLAPTRYPALAPEEMLRLIPSPGLLLSDGNPVLPADVESFLSTQDHAVIFYGRALYPSYYERGDFWGEESPFNVLVREYDRLQFRLIGPKRTDVFIPMPSPPGQFPHAADVVVIGCLGEAGVLRALIVLVNQQQVVVTDPWAGLTCADAK